MNRLLRDEAGTSFIEFTVIFPLTVLVVLGTVDASLLMFDWSSATKATYAGARTATVTDPVAGDAHFSLTSYTSQASYSGKYCFQQGNGKPDTTAACPTVNVTCTGDTTKAGGSCSSGSFDAKAFKAIFDSVQNAYPYRKLDPRQVRVSYVTSSLGFVGQQSFDGTMGELPMNVSVELRCLTHQFYFVSGLVDWTFGTLPKDCSGIALGTDPGLVMPPFYTTLPSEDLYSEP